MGAFNRQAYWDVIQSNKGLTEKQKRDILTSIVNPQLCALEQSIGLAMVFAFELNDACGPARPETKGE